MLHCIDWYLITDFLGSLSFWDSLSYPSSSVRQSKNTNFKKFHSVQRQTFLFLIWKYLFCETKCLQLSILSAMLNVMFCFVLLLSGLVECSAAVSYQIYVQFIIVYTCVPYRLVWCYLISIVCHFPPLLHVGSWLSEPHEYNKWAGRKWEPIVIIGDGDRCII